MGVVRCAAALNAMAVCRGDLKVYKHKVNHERAFPQCRVDSRRWDTQMLNYIPSTNPLSSFSTPVSPAHLTSHHSTHSSDELHASSLALQLSLSRTLPLSKRTIKTLACLFVAASHSKSTLEVLLTSKSEQLTSATAALRSDRARRDCIADQGHSYWQARVQFCVWPFSLSL